MLIWGLVAALGMAGLVLAAWQWWVIAGTYAFFFVVPAMWMARKCRADGERPFVWVLLVLATSVLGIVEYYEHRSIIKRRAKRGQPPP